MFRSFSNNLSKTERRLTAQLFLDVDLSPTFLNTGNTNETFKHPGKQDPFRHKLKVQTHSLLEPPLEYNQDQAPLINQGLL